MAATAALPLDERPVTSLRGVGPGLAVTLARIGLHTVQDLLFHLPLRYEDRTRVVPIGTLRAGDRAVIEGEIQLAEIVFRRRRALLCRIADGSLRTLFRRLRAGSMHDDRQRSVRTFESHQGQPDHPGNQE